ncbi:MAG: AraC family transcriptional regulator [Pseudomonadota bacterium]
MMGTPEELAETPKFETDAFSEVLNILHVRGESARTISPEGPIDVSVTGNNPCIYIVEKGALQISVGTYPSVVIYENQIALLLQGVPHSARFTDCPNPNTAGKSGSGSPPAVTRQNDVIRCFWGSFSFDGELAARMLQTLPQVIVLDNLPENPIEWVDVVCELVLREKGTTRPGSSLMVSRLLDLLLVIILRRWAQSNDALPGWLAAAKDERIARAVSAIHSDPSLPHSNEELAALAGMSKSSFSDRFSQVMGQRPGTYLRSWRLDQAAEALLHSSNAIEVIADRVGYSSKEAFSRAFQTKFGMAPSAWRTFQQS